MSFRKMFRKILLLTALQAALMGGAPMRPDEIEELLMQINQPKLEQLLRYKNQEDEKEAE